MDRDRLSVVLASVMAGVAVSMVSLAVAVQPALLLVALPFALAAYLMWQGATGARLFGSRAQRRRAAAEAEARRAAAEAESGRRDPGDAFDGGPFGGRFDGRYADARRERRRARERAGAGGRTGTEPTGMSRREAAEVLGVAPDAGADAVKAAYRDRVKETHPDADGGDEAAFKRVAAAYERLSE